MEYFTFRNLEDLTGDSARELLQYLIRDAAPMAPLPAGVAPVLKPLRDIKIVIFDIYGTLLISGSGDAGQSEKENRLDSFYRTLEAFELFPLSLAESVREAFFRFIRDSHREAQKAGTKFPEVDILTIWHQILASLGPSFSRPFEPDLSLVASVACFYEGQANPVFPMPGLSSLLGALKEKNITLGLLSNAQFYTPPLLAHHLQIGKLDEIFTPEFCLFSYEKAMAKPSPELFSELIGRGAELFSCRPENILVVGNDMKNDIFPPAGLGCKTALFGGDRRSLRLGEKEPLYSYRKPDIILTELEQLAELLNSP